MPAYRSTPEGGHLPVMPAEVMAALAVRPGDTVIDCTLGAAGHSVMLLQAVGPTGRLIALDLDPANIERARPNLDAVGNPYELHIANFAAVARFGPADAVLADLGVSSMQIDDPGRGFSYRRPGPLDMRMDPNRGRTAADLLQSMGVEELTRALNDLGDFHEFGPQAAQTLAQVLANAKPTTTKELTDLILETVPAPRPPPGRAVKPWQLRYRPVACAFQALRILVNRELANLEALLRSLPDVLSHGARAAIISFHSGEDRLVKSSFRTRLDAGAYSAIADEPVRAGPAERYANPRSRSAKLRWAVRT